MLFTFLIIFLTSWDTNTARYVMIVEKAVNCLPDSRILVNYTYNKATHNGAGYIEFTENIESNYNTLLTMNLEQKIQDKFLPLLIPNFNVTKVNTCVALNADLYVLPYVRQFIYLEKFCPVKKGVRQFKKNTIYPRNTPIIPFGCWSINVTVERNNKIISCIRVFIQLLQSPQSKRFEC